MNITTAFLGRKPTVLTVGVCQNFLGIWEQLHNTAFKPIEFDGFKDQAGANAF